jgi:hypothetical protein
LKGLGYKAEYYQPIILNINVYHDLGYDTNYGSVLDDGDNEMLEAGFKYVQKVGGGRKKVAGKDALIESSFSSASIRKQISWNIS